MPCDFTANRSGVKDWQVLILPIVNSRKHVTSLEVVPLLMTVLLHVGNIYCSTNSKKHGLAAIMTESA